MTAPKLFAYHLGIVVHDREAACARYAELLGVPAWHYSEVTRPGVPVNPNTAGGQGTLHIAFGRVPGMTFEIIQPEGMIEHKVFLDRHGEGVQHIGVWTPDVQAAVRDAVSRGCRVTHAALNQDVATITVTPTSPPEAPTFRTSPGTKQPATWRTSSPGSEPAQWHGYMPDRVESTPTRTLPPLPG